MKGIKKIAFKAKSRKQAKKIIKFFLSNGCTNKAEISNEYVGEYYAVDKEKDLICTPDLQPEHKLCDLSKFLKPSKKELLKRIEEQQEHLENLTLFYNKLSNAVAEYNRTKVTPPDNLEVDFEKVEAKSELEVGKWYKYTPNPKILINYTGSYLGYGFDINGEWGELINVPNPHERWRPATEEEVKSALIAEAERRGFKLKTKIKSFIHNGVTTTLTSDGRCELTEEGFYYYGCVVMQEGKWAEIISQPKEEIDFSQVGLIVHNDYQTVITNGNYDEKSFGGMLIESKNDMYKIGYTCNDWGKELFKLRKEPITISNEIN